MRLAAEFRELLDRPIPGVSFTPFADVTKKTTMKTRARAAMLAHADCPRGLAELLRRARAMGWPLRMLGGGANTLFAAGFYEGVLVTLGNAFAQVEYLGGTMLRAGSATPMPRLLKLANQHGLMGLEFLHMVPGQVGGGLAGNAGAGDYGLCEFLERCLCLTRDGRLLEVGRGGFDYGYRFSELSQVVVLEADFRLMPLHAQEAERRKADFKAKKAGQPYDWPSSGCIFKNPRPAGGGKPVSAGKLIDEAGLKGYRIGDAAVSEGHANFIINLGEATGEDFLALITLIQDVVQEKHGVELEAEVKILGGPLERAAAVA
ncbi:MAG: UDP-N-acetylmuramate dehydrogenase [Candidatus Sumerlaeia bacterium]|nr:UDP-N-acetylmuramate dehydrogenase [Candidatus Sumerlaeia bacterium]